LKHDYSPDVRPNRLSEKRGEARAFPFHTDS
jgi:hypothetical protein